MEGRRNPSFPIPFCSIEEHTWARGRRGRWRSGERERERERERKR